jgi:hypothetical protein
MRGVHQRVTDINPGAGPVVVLADQSTSMGRDLSETEVALPRFFNEIPGLRAFAFHADLVEVSPGSGPNSLTEVIVPRGVHKGLGFYTNCTYLGLALQRVAQLRPAKTIVISDGGLADKRRALRAAANMPGEIDAFCFAREIEWQDRRFMEELARRGRGHFDDDKPFGPKLPERLWPRIKAHRRQEVEIVYDPRSTVSPAAGATSAGQPRRARCRSSITVRKCRSRLSARGRMWIQPAARDEHDRLQSLIGWGRRRLSRSGAQ